ncbi:MAG: ATP-dependent DNA helicase RecG [Patescibacteria group bacterium]|nr:ATP-dependent DNA helicase RecG [Patescibacteria group bacterium]
MNIADPVTTIPGIGLGCAYRLRKLEIRSVGDLLYHVPTRYIDYSLVAAINTLQEGEVVTIKGEVTAIKNNYLRGRRLTIQKAKVADTTGSVDVVWFNQPYLAKNLEKKIINLSGKVKRFGRSLVLESPEYEIIGMGRNIHTGRLVPVYPETKGISSKYLRRKVDYLLLNLSKLEDSLPRFVTNKLGLVSLNQAIRDIHQPVSLEAARLARRRLAFDELFYLQLVSQTRKKEWQAEKVGQRLEVDSNMPKIKEFVSKLPFTLTPAQKKAALEILKDLEKRNPMNRLLQGDVGSGKTVVSAIAIYLTYLNGYNSLFMAPTEILAHQHFQTLTNLLSPLGVKVSLTTGAVKMDDEQSNVIVGTHALLHHKKPFKKVALIIIDEQHRFGVAQRAALRKQKLHPHLLTMTATPIPRTIALTLYGELDLSIIDELPLGRKLIKTYIVTPEKYKAAFNWINQKIKQSKIGRVGEQAFIIYPLIEESEILTEVKAATKEYERLKKEAFPDLKVGLLHGKMNSAEKNKTINAFRQGDVDVLVATSVVEVGVDIPNATIMVVEDAERFGLSQLHQLRGRVGRNEKEAYCLLFSNKDTSRLKAMQKYNLGIKLAEVDLRIRGPGEIYGIRQHGEMELKIADFSDIELVEEARRMALEILETDATLSKYPLLKQKISPKLNLKVEPD